MAECNKVAWFVIQTRPPVYCFVIAYNVLKAKIEHNNRESRLAASH